MYCKPFLGGIIGNYISLTTDIMPQLLSESLENATDSYWTLLSPWPVWHLSVLLSLFHRAWSYLHIHQEVYPILNVNASISESCIILIVKNKFVCRFHGLIKEMTFLSYFVSLKFRCQGQLGSLRWQLLMQEWHSQRTEWRNGNLMIHLKV